MLTNFSSSNKLLFFTPNNNQIDLIDFEQQPEPVSHKLELPFPIKNLHPLSEDKYLVISMPQEEQGTAESNAAMPKGNTKFCYFCPKFKM